MDRKTFLTVAAVVGVVAAALIIGYLIGRATVHNVGYIRAVGVGVYKDQICTERLTEINWNGLSPGESKSFQAYIRNPGTVAGTLSANATNWDPAVAGDYLLFAWNLEGQSLAPDQVRAAVFTLTVSPAVSGVNYFSFDINIWITAPRD